MAAALLYGVGCGHDCRLGSKGEQNLAKPTLLRYFTERPDLEVREVWAGGAHSVVLTNEGLYSFGYNEQGELGVGVFGTVVTPTLISGIKPHAVRGVSLGGYHSMVLLDTGDVRAFGGNASGQLGLGGDDHHKYPAKVEGLPETFEVSCGGQHTVAWTNEGIYTWGLGDNGQLGYTGDSWDVMIAKQNRIKQAVMETARMQQMAGGALVTGGTPEDGPIAPPLEPYNPAKYQARRRSSNREFFEAFCQRTPRRVPFDFPPVMGVTAGYNATAVMTVDGVYIFGANPGVMREDITDTVPKLLPPPEGHVIKQLLPLKELRVALCARDGDDDSTDGALSVWKRGANDDGWVRYIHSPLPPDTKIYGSERSIYAVTPSAHEPLVSFGDNFFGQLGHKTDEDESEDDDFSKPHACDTLQMRRYALVPPKVLRVAVGWRHTLILTGPPPQEDPLMTSEQP